MNRRKWFRLSSSAASSTLLFLSLSAFAVSGVQAQTAESALTGSPLAPQVPAPFLVARSFEVSGAPTGVAVGDLNGDGKLDLVTINNASGKVTVFLGTGEGRFAPGLAYSTGGHPSAIAVADLNGDGRTEVIVCDEAASTVSVLSSGGDGKLQLAQTQAIGIAPAFLAAGDFNGDGKTDLVVASGLGRVMAVLLNDGKGNLQKPILTALQKLPTAIAVADVNHDEHNDVALANADGTISILLGTGNGKFHALADIAVTSGPLAGILAEDFDRDGKVDLSVTQASGNKLSVLLGNGDGSFRAAESYLVGSNPVSLISADFDGDGVADLIAINQGSNTFTALGGNGDGTFRSGINFIVGNGPMAAVAGDFDGDGRTDLAVINHGSQTVSVALGNGDNTFKAARSYYSDIQPRAIASGDLNGDKRPDLVVASYCGTDSSCSKAGTVDIFLADENGDYELSHSYLVGTGPIGVALLDVDGDNHLDIVALNREDKTISLLLAKGDGSFEQPLTLSVASAPLAVAVGDFNKDGKLDLAILEDCGAAKCSQPGSVEVMLGQGDGGFRSAFSYAVGYSPTTIAVGDLNLDKNLDIVVANRCGHDAECQSPGTATVLIGNANGKFKLAPEVALGNLPSSIALADLTGHGVLDLAVTRSEDNSLSILHGNGDGSFQAPATYKVGIAPGSIAVADFNGDGVPDLAVANVKDATVSVLFGKGDGTLNSSITLPVGKGPESLIAVAAINGRHASLATANGDPGSTTPGREITVLANVSPQVPPSGTTASSTVLTVIAKPAPPTVNQQVLLTATVTGVPGTLVPTGTVTFNSSPDAIADCNGTTSNVVTTSTNNQYYAVWTCTTSSLQATSQSLTAVYSGDSTYAGSTSAVVVQAVTPLPATLIFNTFSPDPASVDEAVTLLGKITTTKPSPTPLGGTVTYTVNGKVACAVTVTVLNGGGVANCLTSSLLASIPTNTVIATYTPDKNFSVTPSTGTVSESISVSKASLVTAVQSSAPTSSVNEPVTFSATLRLTGVATAPSPTQPNGTVAFTQGSTTLCTAAVNPFTATATCAPLAFGAVTAATGVTITATYSGDGNFNGGTGTTKQIVVSSPTKTTLISSPNPSIVNAPVTFTATVTPTYPGATVFKTGDTVVFTDTTAATTLCTEPVSTSGVVTPCIFTFTKAETHSVTAAFTPSPADTSFSASTSPTVAQVVNSAATSLIVSSTPATTSVNQSVIISSTLTFPSGGNKPNGTVAYTDSLVPGVTFCTEPVANGVVTACPPYTLLVAGTHAITGQFTPTPTSTGTDFLSATSPIFNLIVNPGATKVAFTAPTASSTVDQVVTFTATLTPTNTGTTNPTGSIAFSYVLNNVQTALCSRAVTTSKTAPIVTSASCQAPFIATGLYTVTATYSSGDGNFTPGPAATQSQTVTAANTSVTYSVISPSPLVNQTVGFTAVVTPTGTGVSETFNGKTLTLPAGSVTFKDTGGQALCTSTLAADGSLPACQSVLPTAGSHTITAVYSPAAGDANFNGSSSSPTSQAVTPDTTTLSVASSLQTSVATQNVTFIATLTPTFVGATLPSAAPTFTLTQGSSTFPCVTETPSNVASGGTSYLTKCDVSFPPTASGTISVVASFANDPNFSGSTSAAISQTVQNFSPTIQVVNNDTKASSAGPLTLTQGSSNANDPFSASSIALPLGPLNGYGDSVTVTCNAPSGLSCTSIVNPTSTTPGSLILSAAATASIGPQVVTLTYTDTAFNTLTHQATLTVDVINLASQATTSVVGSGTANFTVAPPPPVINATVLSFGQISTVTSNGTYAPVVPAAGRTQEETLGVTFSAISGSGSSFQFTITANATVSAKAANSGNIVAAAALGAPLLVLMAFLPGLRSRRRKWLNYLGISILALAALNGIGCSSGGFLPNQSTPAQVGSYVVQIVDTQTNTTVAVVPLEIDQ